MCEWQTVSYYLEALTQTSEGDKQEGQHYVATLLVCMMFHVPINLIAVKQQSLHFCSEFPILCNFWGPCWKTWGRKTNQWCYNVATMLVCPMFHLPINLKMAKQRRHIYSHFRCEYSIAPHFLEALAEIREGEKMDNDIQRGNDARLPDVSWID